jgi:hypothetical protein
MAAVLPAQRRGELRGTAGSDSYRHIDIVHYERTSTHSASPDARSPICADHPMSALVDPSSIEMRPGAAGDVTAAP